MNRQLRFENLEKKELLATLLVTSSGDSGPGTLRDAFEQANADPEIDRIKFEDTRNVRVNTPLVYTGTQRLVINVAPQDRINLRPSDLNAERVVLMSIGGGDLQLNKLTFHESDVAIKIEVPSDHDMHNTLSLREVFFRNNKSIISMIEEDNDDNSTSGGDLRLRLRQTSILGENVIEPQIEMTERGNGNAVVEIQNGGNNRMENFLQVSEAGNGSARVTVKNFAIRGRDSITIREGDAGRVFFSSINSQYFAESGTSLAVDIVELEGGSVDVDIADSLFDRHGIRIREDASGPIKVSIADTKFSDTQTLSAFEAGGGNLTFFGERIDASDGSLTLFEKDNGHLDVDAQSVNIINVKNGFQIDEQGNGFVRANFTDIYVNTSEILAPFTAQSISIQENDAGGLNAAFERVHLSGVEFKSIPESGIELISMDEGKIDATVIDSVFNDVKTGIIAKQDNDDPFEFGSLEMSGDNIFRAENEFELLNVNLL